MTQYAATQGEPRMFVKSVHGIRYQVKDGASGSRAIPNGETQGPGGWNRIILTVADLPACITALKQAGIQLRKEIETGPGGKQIQIEDPDGNPIELFEPAR